jgi:hypothetical protein
MLSIGDASGVCTCCASRAARDSEMCSRCSGEPGCACGIQGARCAVEPCDARAVTSDGLCADCATPRFHRHWQDRQRPGRAIRRAVDVTRAGVMLGSVTLTAEFSRLIAVSVTFTADTPCRAAVDSRRCDTMREAVEWLIERAMR